jgi:hypothetical protein
MLTGDVLRKRGIDLSDEEFALLLDDALEASTGMADDPVTTLTPAETKALAGGGADLRPRGETEPPPRAEAAASYGALLAESFSVAQVSSQLGIDASRVRHRLAERSLYGIRLKGSWRLPAFQFTDDGVVPGLDVVLPTLPDDLHPVAVRRWLTTPVSDLSISGRRGAAGVSPLEWLSGGGDPHPVAALATDL